MKLLIVCAAILMAFAKAIATVSQYLLDCATHGFG